MIDPQAVHAPLNTETEASAEQADGRALIRLGLWVCAVHCIVPM